MQTLFLFHLRHNIALEGDLFLAELELSSFLSSPLSPIEDLPSAISTYFPQSCKPDTDDLTQISRRGKIKAFLGAGNLDHLPDLIKRLSFVQRIYCLTVNSAENLSHLHSVEASVGPVITISPAGDHILVEAVPHYAIFEFSDVVARKSKDPSETRRNLVLMLDALMHRNTTREATRQATIALSAQITTSHLSHDIHYYKAKFFPRLVRSMLNVCTQQLGTWPVRVLDNFVGSGTTLLEAATMGLPSTGLDIDPLSCLIAETKLLAVNIDSELVTTEAVKVRRFLFPSKAQQPSIFEQPSNSAQIDWPPIQFPKWFTKNRKVTPEVIGDLEAEIMLVRTAISAADPRVTDLFRVLLSDAIARRIRMRFMGTGVGRFSFSLAKTTLVRHFINSVDEYAKVAATSAWLKEVLKIHLAETSVIQGDTRAIPPNLGPFDLILTSPPYLPASSGRESYARSRAPSLVALGMLESEDVDNLADDSVGSMDGAGTVLSTLTDAEKRVVEWLQADELRRIKAEPTARYFLDMRRTFEEMYRVLRPGSMAVVVSGKESTFYAFSSREALMVVPCAQILADEAKRAGFTVEHLYDVQLNKGNRNARPRSLDDYYETLIVLRK